MTKMIELTEATLEAVSGGTFKLNAQKTNNSTITLKNFSASAIGFCNTAGVVIGVTQVNG